MSLETSNSNSNSNKDLEAAAAAEAITDVKTTPMHQQQQQQQQVVTTTTLPTECPNCHQSTEINLCEIDIPHFKQVLLMTLVCQHCNYRNTDVQPTGGISNGGTKITLQIRSEEDLKRELILSSTASIGIPEIELEQQSEEVGGGTITMDHQGAGAGTGGVYTTVEGLLKRLFHRLSQANPFHHEAAAAAATTAAFTIITSSTSDSSTATTTPDALHAKYRTFLSKLHDIGEGTLLPATLIVNDPLSNSFVGPTPKDSTGAGAMAFCQQLQQQQQQAEKKRGHDVLLGSSSQKNCRYQNNNGLEYVDEGLTVEFYNRSFEQNESLGINHVKTESY